MRWQTGRRSENVEDRRGMRPTRMAIGGGIGGLVIVVVALLLGVDPRGIDTGTLTTQQAPEDVPTSQPTDEMGDFVTVVLGDTEDTWRALFSEMGQTYREPTLVLFTDAAQSACGFAQAAMGPFYCPGDEKVYIDLGFYNDLRERLGAPGDFAQAYVIAHEVGHHVQNLLGITDRMSNMRGRVTEEEYNQLSVRLELQADFLAGVWAHHAQARSVLEAGDIEEALNAASAIGDDRLQQQSRGYVTPDSFTHGTSEQRARWFRRGFETGDVAQGDTFAAEEL